MQDGRIQAFGEPAVHRGEQVTRFGAPAFVAPELREAGRGTRKFRPSHRHDYGHREQDNPNCVLAMLPPGEPQIEVP